MHLSCDVHPLLLPGWRTGNRERKGWDSNLSNTMVRISELTAWQRICISLCSTTCRERHEWVALKSSLHYLGFSSMVIKPLKPTLVRKKYLRPLLPINKRSRKNLPAEGVASQRRRTRSFARPSSTLARILLQSTCGYYKRIHDYFCEHKPEGSARSQVAIQHRWQLIQKGVNKFCALKSAVDRRNESGKNEQDRIDDAVKMYEKTEAWTFMHCWMLLCNEPKWSDQMLELNSSLACAKGRATSQTNSNAGCMESSNNSGEIPRPEGRDSAKRRRSNGDAASSSTAVEVLQQMHERNEKTEVKQDQQMQEILTMKGDKMKLSEKMYDLHKHDMEVRTRLKEQQLSLTKQDIEV